MTTDKLDIAELKQLRNEMLEAGFARETNTYHALRDELSELIFDHHDELIALAEHAQKAESQVIELSAMVKSLTHELAETMNRLWAVQRERDRILYDKAVDAAMQVFEDKVKEAGNG